MTQGAGVPEVGFLVTFGPLSTSGTDSQVAP